MSFKVRVLKVKGIGKSRLIISIEKFNPELNIFLKFSD